MNKLCRIIKEIIFDIKRYPCDYIRAEIGFVVVAGYTVHLQNEFGIEKSILIDNFGKWFLPVFFGAVFFVFAFRLKILKRDMLKFCGWLLGLLYLEVGFGIVYIRTPLMPIVTSL